MSIASERELTQTLARASSTLAFEELPADVVELARQALLDWFGVTIAGSREDAVTMLIDVLAPGGRTDARGVTVVGHSLRLPAPQAALVNGTASHVLDFDDVNLTLPGHVSVAILVAVLALAEQRGCSGRELITAFVAGYEAACRVAATIGPQPYLRGFHATGTVGTFGAAAACARLLGLERERTAVAFGLAASQAAGVKANFGTMTKSLHAGRACENGLLAALLAERGFTANAAALEAAQGFADASGGSCDAAAGLSGPAGGWYLRENLFKFHATCFFTHSTLEGIRELRSRTGFTVADVEELRLHVSEVELGACAIPRPATALEVKFSLSHLAAMALLGRDTTVIGEADAADGDALALRDKVLLIDDARAGEPTVVELRLRDGETLRAAVDVERPQTDLAAQHARLTAKFVRLAEPVLGRMAATELAAQVRAIDSASEVRQLMALTAP